MLDSSQPLSIERIALPQKATQDTLARTHVACHKGERLNKQALGPIARHFQDPLVIEVPPHKKMGETLSAIQIAELVLCCAQNLEPVPQPLERFSRASVSEKRRGRAPRRRCVSTRTALAQRAHLCVPRRYPRPRDIPIISTYHTKRSRGLPVRPTTASRVSSFTPRRRGRATRRPPALILHTERKRGLPGAASPSGRAPREKPSSPAPRHLDTHRALMMGETHHGGGGRASS